MPPTLDHRETVLKCVAALRVLCKAMADPTLAHDVVSRWRQEDPLGLGLFRLKLLTPQQREALHRGEWLNIHTLIDYPRTPEAPAFSSVPLTPSPPPLKMTLHTKGRPQKTKTG